MDGVFAGNDVGDGRARLLAGCLCLLGRGGGLVFGHCCGFERWLNVEVAGWEEVLGK